MIDRQMDREKPDRGQAKGHLDAILFFNLKMHILSQSNSDANVRCQWTKTK